MKSWIFYINFTLVDETTMTTIVKGLDLVFGATTLEENLKVPVEVFETYVKGECPNVREKEDDKHLTVK